ncbi:MAG: SRPBCC family protein [Flavobacteriaceae bacterium]|nr:SRPBCC family protein [Flavobacteriaceae bacterium]|tara:strand:+ start:236 stop:739 length:504 start_codon:yes stop_codon:yes gene_type:complete
MNELSSLSTQSKIVIDSPIEQTWAVLSNPSHLEHFHPFCQSNRAINWDSKQKIDELKYINGLVYERHFYAWEEGNGFKLYIGKKEGKKSKVEWSLKPLDNKTQLTIKITPYKSSKFSSPFLTLFMFINILPRLKKYLNHVTRGFKYYLETGKTIQRNQFGTHDWFSI